MKSAWEALRNNGPETFAIALAIATGVILAILAVRFAAARIVRAIARKAAVPAGENAADAIAATKLWLLLPFALMIGASALELQPQLERTLEVAAIAGVALQAGLWITHMIRGWVRRRTSAQTTDGDAITALALLGFAARVVVWALVLLSILDQMGFNITALVAGLGIGGVAVALAVQNILGDLFASLSIVLDKPFVVGDFIVVDTMRGTVERIGVKSTRVRSLDGEGIVFSNSELLKSRIRNFKQMRERRVLFTIGITYETSPEDVRAVPGMVESIVKAQEKTRFDRAHFKEYGDSALVFEIVYYVLDPAYNTYMDIQQEINLALFSSFAERGLSFAYPTHTLHLASAPEALDLPTTRGAAQTEIRAADRS